MTTTNTVYVDTDFEVRCEIDRTAATEPTSYEILVDGTTIRNGAVTSTMNEITETIRLTSGTHRVECLIKGSDNTDYVDPRCSAEIIPRDVPGGNCQNGDDIT